MQASELTERRSQKTEAVRAGPWTLPRVDVFENSHEILVLAELPGVRADGLRIDVDKDRLTLEARRSDREIAGSELSAEYRPVDYRRSFAVPEGIDRSKIDAELKDGVLKLRLPRADALKPRTIPVRA
jgi:HSP20 family molecular chaperone IbpA